MQNVTNNETNIIKNIYSYVSSKMDVEWENLPDAYQADTVKLGDVEYKSLIRYMAFEEIMNYMEKLCPTLEE